MCHIETEPAVHKTQIASRVLYESDYSFVKAEDILSSLSGDPRLKHVRQEELLGTSVAKLAVQAKLISSNCEYHW